MPCYSYPESLGDPQAKLSLIMSLTNMQMLTNMTHIQYYPR